ncbi:MAG: hypothetical protein WBP81_06005 [Solirubrobacteraceae bacterium]
MNSSLYMQLARALIADRLRDAEERRQPVQARQATVRGPRRRPLRMHGRARFQRSRDVGRVAARRTQTTEGES